MSTEPTKRVWNKLAVHGVFNGHPAGPFKMDAETFAQIVRNFDREAIPIPIDYEHASERPATEGSIPQNGAPAVGWIHELQARADGLFGAVEWLPKTREQIRGGQYKFISPAIRFGARDGKTNAACGAKLSSAGLTNQPFLKALPPLIAKDAGTEGAFLCSEVPAEPAIILDAQGGYAISANEFLPRFRRALHLDELACPSDMLARVERLMDLCDMADGDTSGVVEGISLASYIAPLSDLMRMPMNTTTSDMLEAVAEMIESCIVDDDAVTTSDKAPVAEPQTSPAGAPPAKKDQTMETITLSEHETKVKLAVSEAVATAVQTAVAPLNLQLNDAQAKLAKAESDNVAAQAMVVNLTDQLKVVADAAIADRVEQAFSTYKESHKLTDLHKKQMKLTLMNDPETFAALYPVVAPDKQPLLRVLSKDTSVMPTGAKPVVPSVLKLCQDIQTKSPTISYDDAFTLALQEQAKLLAAG
jgi:hypothetical protein